MGVGLSAEWETTLRPEVVSLAAVGLVAAAVLFGAGVGRADPLRLEAVMGTCGGARFVPVRDGGGVAVFSSIIQLSKVQW